MNKRVGIANSFILINLGARADATEMDVSLQYIKKNTREFSGL
jgi:hypothetical protein